MNWMQTETASLQETISLHGLTCPAALPGDCRTVAVGGPHIWVCTGSLSRGSKDIPSESRAHAARTFSQFGTELSTLPELTAGRCWGSPFPWPARSFPQLHLLFAGTNSFAAMCTARLCRFERDCWSPLCHKDQEQPKARDGKLSCLEVSAARGERGRWFPKDDCELLTFPAYVRNIWRTLMSPNLKVREMHCWEQVHILPFQGMGLFRWAQRMSPHPL